MVKLLFQSIPALAGHDHRSGHPVLRKKSSQAGHLAEEMQKLNAGLPVQSPAFRRLCAMKAPTRPGLKAGLCTGFLTA